MFKRENLRAFGAVLVCLLLFWCVAARGETIYIDADANGSGDGSSWTNAFNYLQDALADANSNPDINEIRVAQGVYKPDANSANPSGSFERTATFQLINGVSIYGGYAGFNEPDPNARDIQVYETILSGDLDGNDIDVNDPFDLFNEPTRGENSYHVVTSNGTNETAIMDGFTIKDGHAYDGSTMPNDRGGGMYNDSGRPIVTNCTFSANAAYRGGGMYNVDSNPNVTNCTFNWNAASNGGGMYNVRSSTILKNCMFDGNWAVNRGGGVYNYFSSSPTIENCIFTQNAGRLGGGINNRTNSSPIIKSCTLSGNSADTNGGGICNEDSEATIINCILWADTPEEIYLDNSTVEITYSDVQGDWLGEGNIDIDPCFADSDANDFRLQWDSPCIDTGDPCYIPGPNEKDLDGNPRIIGDVIDMGAYEYNPPIPAEVDIKPETLNLSSKGKWVTCYIRLPQEYDINEIDPNSILLGDEDQIGAESVLIEQKRQVAVARFSRSDVQQMLAGLGQLGQVELLISGELTDNTAFEAVAVIKVVSGQ